MAKSGKIYILVDENDRVVYANTAKSEVADWLEGAESVITLDMSTGTQEKIPATRWGEE